MNGGLNELELFAGAGGGILGSQLLGHRTVCAVEFDAYARSVLLARQADRTFPPFPVWDDVRTFDGRPWRVIVDVVSGGFPCQDISVAGKGAGIDGERSGLWGEMARVVGEVRPRFVFVENSPALVTRGLDRVIGDLTALGYDSRWIVMGAADVGAPHQRDRLWLLASDTRQHRRGKWKDQQVAIQRGEGAPDAGADGAQRTVADAANSRIYESWRSVGLRKDVQLIRGNERDGISSGTEKETPILAHAYGAQRQGNQRQGNQRQERNESQYADISRPGWWRVEPGVGRVVDGMAHRAHRLKAIGNGQVPQCRAAAWRILGGD